TTLFRSRLLAAWTCRATGPSAPMWPCTATPCSARRAARCPGAPASVRSPRTDRTLTRTPRLRGRRAYGYAAPTHCAASPARRPSSSSAPLEGSASSEGSLPVEGSASIEGSLPVEGPASVEESASVEGSAPIECLVRGVLAPAEALELHSRWSAVRSVRSEPRGQTLPVLALLRGRRR